MLPLHSAPLPPTLLPAAAEIGVCCFFVPRPRCDLRGLSPLSPRGTSRGSGAMAKSTGAGSCQRCPPVPPCPARDSSGVQTPPGTRGTPLSHRQLLATTSGRGQSWWPKLVAEPLCRAPGQQKPKERKQERGGSRGCLVAPTGGLTPCPGPSSPVPGWHRSVSGRGWEQVLGPAAWST